MGSIWQEGDDYRVREIEDMQVARDCQAFVANDVHRMR